MNEIIALLILLILSGFFSGSETALTSISKARAEGLRRELRPGAKALWRLKSNTTRMLVIILIGNNVVNIGASALATVIATEWFGHIGPGIAVGVLTILILVFGEVTPKSWAAQHAERVSLFAAPLIVAFGQMVLPLVWALVRFTRWLHRATRMVADPTVTESELLSMAEHGAEEGTIEREEQEMIERVFAFNDLRVRDVMTPRNEVFSMDGSRAIEDALPELLATPFSRVPLYQNDRDDIRKILHLRDVLEAVAKGKLDAPLHSIAHETVFAPQTQPIDELFATLRRRKRHLAMVVNEYGMLQGVVSLEDLLEELVGEIYDETDTPMHALSEIKAGQISVSGSAEMRQVEFYFHLEDLLGKPTDTVSLWILNHAERIPEAGERFQINGLDVYVENATRRQIERVRITRSAEAAATDDSSPSQAADASLNEKR